MLYYKKNIADSLIAIAKIYSSLDIQKCRKNGFDATHESFIKYYIYINFTLIDMKKTKISGSYSVC